MQPKLRWRESMQLAMAVLVTVLVGVIIDAIIIYLTPKSERVRFTENKGYWVFFIPFFLSAALGGIVYSYLSSL